MRFRRGARVDTTQVRDLRGRRMGGAPMAIGGGGGIGLAVLVVYLLVSALGGGGGSALDDLAGVEVGPGAAPQGEELAHCRGPDVDLNAQEDCRLLAVVNTHSGVLGARVRAPRPPLPRGDDDLLRGPGADRLRLRV